MPYTSSRLQVGKLRHRIQIVKPYGPAQSTFGDVSLQNFSPVRTCWAAIEALQGKDALAANQFADVVTHKITIRYRNDVFAQDMIWFQGPGTYVRQFQVQAVINPDERNKTLFLLAVEIDQSTNQTTGTPSETLG
jgi:SPP1 family predicted phage head-tail adaptor